MEVCNLNTQDEFSLEEIHEAALKNRLLTMEIELSLKCNYNCIYCYTDPLNERSKEISFSEIRDVLLQAKELGAGKIIILGGEPTIYPDFFRVVDYISELGMKTEIFTNGSKITPVIAKKLFQRNVRTVIKLNSLKPERMNSLTGNPKSFTNSMNAINNLLAAGYPDEEHFIGVSTVISKINEDEITGIWKWLKDRKITPYFEMITPQGKAKEVDWLSIKPEKLKKIFEDLAETDLKRYGKKWKIQPPLVGSRCMRHLYSCLVDSFGNVKPCVGVNIITGNIIENKLEDIIKNSAIIQELRDYRNNIKGPCRKCDQADHCYGCRGAAYQLTGDPLASDPTCWRNRDKLESIYSLPYPVDDIIPQKKSMKMVDKIIDIGDKTAETVMKVKPDNIFLNTDGTLSDSVYTELIAQTAASVTGFRALENGEKPDTGYIIGIKGLEIAGNVKVGDELKIKINRTFEMDEIIIVDGAVYKVGQEKKIAAGTLKIWRNLN